MKEENVFVVGMRVVSGNFWGVIVKSERGGGGFVVQRKVLEMYTMYDRRCNIKLFYYVGEM